LCHNGVAILLRGYPLKSRATNANPSVVIAGYGTIKEVTIFLKIKMHML